MTATAKLGLELLANAAANQTLANTTFAQLNQLVQAGVVDKDLATPPSSPADEALYIVAASPTGAWAGKAGQLAYWLTSTGAWQFIVPRAGFAVRVLDELEGSGLPKIYGYSGSAWVGQAGGVSLSVVQTFTGNKTLALADINTYNVSQDATAQTVTIPAQATVTWTADAEIHIERGAAGAVTVTGATGVSVNGVSAGSFTLAAQFSVVTLKRVGSNSWTLIGGLANSLVSGPASSGDGNIALYSGTTGKVIRDGGVVTAAGLALLDDASASAQRTTLGVGTGDSPTFTSLTLTNGQIAFPATQVPSAGANTLDDYEEGTWTPTLTFATPGDLSVAYTNRTGIYTKIGNLVFLGYAVITSTFTHTTSSGDLRLTGAPFAASVIAGRGYGGFHFSGITKTAYTNFTSGALESDSFLIFIASGSGQAVSTVKSSDMPTGGSVSLLGSVQHRAA